MRILFLIQGPDVPSSRYRVLQYLPYLKGRGVEAEVRPFPETLRDRRKTYGSAGGYDAVFIHRKRLSAFWLRYLRTRAKRLVYDFDDAVMYRDTLSLGKQASGTRRRQFERTVSTVDAVIAGNSYLAEHARPHNRNVVLIPTCLDMGRYAPRSWDGAPADGVVTLGWIGDTGSFAYLESQRSLFESIGRSVPGLRFKVVSSRFPEYSHLPVVPKRWKAEEELADLQSFDIGIMPLSDDPWSRGKCGLKLLQYMGAGVPAVCSPVGVNRDIVEDGVHGYFATTEAEWIDRIRRLAADPDARRRMGRASHRRVLEGYSLEACAPRLFEVLKG